MNVQEAGLRTTDERSEALLANVSDEVEDAQF